MVHRPSFGMVALLAVATVIGVACSGSDSAGISTPPAPPAEQLVVAITPRLDSLPLGASRGYTASVTTLAGVPRGVAVSWSSLTPALVTVSGGSVTAVATGEGRIVARAGASADTATIIVIAPRLELQLTPGAIDAFIGDTLIFEAHIVGSSGASTHANDLTWSMSDSAAARFVNAGTVTALGEGELKVYASLNGLTAVAALKVHRAAIASIAIVPNNLALAVGERSSLRAEARDDRGRLIANAPITWRASQPAVATVSVAGEVQGVAAGGTVVTATSGSKSASAAINVNSAAAASVTLSLPTDSLGTGRTMQASAEPRDASGQLLVGRPVAWQSSNPSVATVTSAGVISALKAGKTTISVVCDGRVASTWLYSVVPVPTSVRASPDSALLMVGTTTRFSAEVRDQLGVVLSGTSLGWSSTAPAVATVDGTGTVSARAMGSTTIRVATGALSASVAITVQAVPVASVSIAPATVSVVQGAAVTLSVTARDAGGNTLANRPVTWSSSAPAIASASTNGMVQGVGVGSATVTAIVEGKSAQATVVVTSPPPPVAARVVVTLNSSVLSVGQGTTAVAKVYDVTGQEISSAVTFSTGDPSIASVSANGHVQGLSAGTTTVEASADGKVGIASVTVAPIAPPPVATVQLSIPTNALVVGDTTVMSVVLRDSAGAVLSGRTVSLTSSNSQVVTVGAAGNVRAVGVGSASITASSEGKSAVALIVVSVPSPTVTHLTISPKTVSLNMGATLQFGIVAEWTDGSTGSPPLLWSATGGTISAAGLYATGSALGVFRVIATTQGGGRADTAEVTVHASPPSLLSLAIRPRTVSLSPGQTQQFAVVGSWSDGGSASPSVSYSATSGSISSNGLYSAGSQPGTYVVKAVHQSSTVVDSAIVIITSTIPGLQTFERPFSSLSPWNTPITSYQTASYQPTAVLNGFLPALSTWPGALWVSMSQASSSDPIVNLYFHPDAWINVAIGRWKRSGNSAAIEAEIRAGMNQSWAGYEANMYSTTTPNVSAFPLVFHARQSNYWTLTPRVPTAAEPPPDADGHMTVFQPNGWALEMLATIKLSNGDLVTMFASFTDPNGLGAGDSNGRRATMVPNYAGLIRAGELSSGHISHALSIGLGPEALATVVKWPAAAMDRETVSYAGDIPYGALLSIPPTLDLLRLGLRTAEGMTLARAAQEYGMYVTDRAGSRYLLITAETGVGDVPVWSGPLDSDLRLIMSRLQQTTLGPHR